MPRGSRWTLKQEYDIRKLWDLSIPVIINALSQPEMAPGKKLDIAMAVVQKFGIVRPPEAVLPNAGQKVVLMVNVNGTQTEIPFAHLFRPPVAHTNGVAGPVNGADTQPA